MKFLQLILSVVLLTGLSYAQNRKDDTNASTQKNTKQEKIKLPKWAKMDQFNIKTTKGYDVHLLSTKKGYLFDKGKGKVTMLILIESHCKSCPGWLNKIEKIQKHYGKKMKVYVLAIDNVDKEKLEKAIKNKTIGPKVMKKVITDNNAFLNKYAKKHHISLPVISIMSTDQNLQFAMQTIYKYQFFKPRGKLIRGGGLPYNIIFGPQGQTAGITVGVSESKAFQDYIGKIIQHYKIK